MARSDLGRLLHGEISYQHDICCLFTGKCNLSVVLTWRLSTLFTIVAATGRKKMDLRQNCSAQI